MGGAAESIERIDAQLGYFSRELKAGRGSPELLRRIDAALERRHEVRSKAVAEGLLATVGRPRRR